MHAFEFVIPIQWAKNSCPFLFVWMYFFIFLNWSSHNTNAHSRERLFAVIGFNTPDVMGCGLIECSHELTKRLTEL